jgi:hypothetical protein
VLLLPFLEKQELWSHIDTAQAWDADANQFLAEARLDVFVCPAFADDAKARPSLTSYIGMAGVGADAATFALEHTQAGVFGYDRRVRVTDITDGSSNTMMIIETATGKGPWAAGGPSTVRGLDPDQKPYLAVDGPFGLKHYRDVFRTNARLGSNIGLADGSVRGVLASVSSETLEALATIAGGDSPGDDW